MLRLSRLAARLAAPRVLPVIYLHSQVLYVSAVSLALASFAALALGFVQGAAPLVLVSIAYSALAALALASLALTNHHGPAKLRCRFPSARFPGEINSRELAVADF